MKSTNLLIVFLLSCSLMAQTKAKKEYFFSDSSKLITYTEFKKQTAPPDYRYTYSTFENDTAVFKKLVLRKEYGVIEETDRVKVIEALENLTGKTISKDQTIIINFFFKNLNGNTTLAVNHYPSDGAYKRFIKRNHQYAQFFMSEKGLQHKKDYVYEDKDEVIRNMFFPYNFEANYIIVKPNGHYYKQVGEYRQWEIPAILEAEW